MATGPVSAVKVCFSLLIMNVDCRVGCIFVCFLLRIFGVFVGGLGRVVFRWAVLSGSSEGAGTGSSVLQ